MPPNARSARSGDSGLGFDFAVEDVDHEMHLGTYVEVLRRRWRLGVLIVLISVAGGLVHFLITPPMYRATTTIQIDRQSLSRLGGVEAPWLESWWNMEFYPTQYKLLESRGLAEQVIRRLELYDHPVFAPGRAVARADVADEAATPIQDETASGRLGQRLLGGLTVAPVKGTQLVNISYRVRDAVLAAEIANGVADAYIAWGSESRRDSIDTASTFLGKQVETLKQEIQDKESALQGLGRRSDIVGLDTQSSSPTMQRLEALNGDYISAVSGRIDKEVRYNEALSAPAETVADTLSGGLVSQLRGDLLTLEQEYAAKLNVYKADWPAMIELRTQIDEARQHYSTVIDEMVDQARRTARTEFQTARRREEALAAELERTKEETISLGSAAVQYNNLRMEVGTRRQLLDELLRRQSEAEVAIRLQAEGQSNVRVIDRALVPGAPYLPSMRRDVGMALALGVFLGVGCIFLLEYLDRTVKTAEEAERLLGIPVLAVIPDVSESGPKYGYGYRYGAGRRRRSASSEASGERRGVTPIEKIELLPLTRPRHAISESYRSLRTALTLSTTVRLRSLALTSAHSGEGKTATVANLALVMAQLGRRVLLVDADLRKPRLHRVFGLTNRAGLVHALTGGGDLAEVALETSQEGLLVVPSGVIPPNPSELLASERMRQILQEGQRGFDVVLIDTPPLLAVTDASVVGAMVDGMVLCLQAGRVLREEAVAGVDRLHLGGVRILGSVLNRYSGASASEGKHYYYYTAYGEGSESQSENSAA